MDKKISSMNDVWVVAEDRVSITPEELSLWKWWTSVEAGVDLPLLIGFGTFFYFAIQLGMSSSQLTFTPSFFRGVGLKTTNHIRIPETPWDFGDVYPLVICDIANWKIAHRNSWFTH